MTNNISTNSEKENYRIINLPISILKECKNKTYLRSVAVSIYIKTHRGDSLFRNTSIRSIKSSMGVGQAKAKKVSEMLKSESKFFKYNSYTDTVTARTFKNEAKVKYNRNGKRMVCMYAVRLKVEKSWGLTMIERYIHDMIYLNAVNATERSDKFNACRKIKNNILLTTKDALTLTKMGHIGGVCKSTAKRHLEKLKNNNAISIKYGYMQVVLWSVNENTVNDLGLRNVRFVKDGKRNLGYIFTPNEYHIANRNITQSFRHIIFNSKRRQKYNAPTNTIDILESEFMGMFH